MASEHPDHLRANAWEGTECPLFDFPASPGEHATAVATFAPRYLPRPWDWRSPDVGWGLVLCDDPELSAKDKAAGADAPEPIRRLLAARAPAPILRYQPDRPAGRLVRYYADGAHDLLSTMAPDRGTREGQIPQYLLIYGSPSEIPWAVQYNLNFSAFVGRLDLGVEEGLGHYVDALISDWAGRSVGDARKPLVWSADWGMPDVTSLLGQFVGQRLSDRFAADAELDARFWLTGARASCDGLCECLTVERPGFICTTSHGMTGPLKDKAATVSNLGSPVDSARRPLKLGQLNVGSTGGAIWYSHACCSAGSDRVSRYEELIGPDQRGGALLRQIAEVSGARVAPLPRMLLGAPNPIAAFVGHVEPTFDWTLRDPITKRETTDAILRCFYDRLFTGEHPAPVGWALADIFDEAKNFLGLAQAPGQTDNRLALDVYRKLAGIDRQNIVIVGDPTVTIRFGAEQAPHRPVSP